MLAQYIFGSDMVNVWMLRSILLACNVRPSSKIACSQTCSVYDGVPPFAQLMESTICKIMQAIDLDLLMLLYMHLRC
jgi:hypothetical protein